MQVEDAILGVKPLELVVPGADCANKLQDMR